MKNTDFRFIQSVVDEVFEPEEGWAVDSSRRNAVVEPRQVAHWVMYYFTKHELRNISFWFGRRSHDMVIHSVRTVNGRLQTDYEFACKIRTIIDYLSLKGFKLVYKYGRVVFENKQQSLSFVTNYAKKPKQRKDCFVVKPNLVERLIKDRNQFLTEYDELKHKRRQIAKTKDFEKVIKLAKEISILETSVKAVAKHII